MHFGDTILDGQGAIFDGFIPKIFCLLLGVGAFVCIILLKIPAEVALQST